jgi:hypothetical protein
MCSVVLSTIRDRSRQTEELGPDLDNLRSNLELWKHKIQPYLAELVQEQSEKFHAYIYNNNVLTYKNNAEL